jgi:phosphoglycerol transferase
MDNRNVLAAALILLTLTDTAQAIPVIPVAPNESTPVLDPLAPRYQSTLAEGIDFRKPGYPEFLKEVTGVSIPELWGRWTDANLSPTAKFKFKKPLPRSFTLILEAHAFGPNLNAPITIRAGRTTKTLVIDSAREYRIKFAKVKSDDLEIIPPKPTAPKDVDPTNADPRKLGLGLTTLKMQ